MFVIKVDVLGLTKFVEAFLAEFAGVTSLLHAAERAGIVVAERIVDPERAGGDLVHRLHRPFHVVRVNVRAEAIDGVVGEFDGVVDVFHAHDRQHRAERLGVDEPHLLFDVHHDGWFVEETFLKM